MVEKIETFSLKDTDTAIPMNRPAFYDEQTKLTQPSRAVAIVNILIFNEHGELFLQKRSAHKHHNPGLIDKSIGGHITYGDTPDYTVMVETVQELQVPSIVLRNDKDFVKTLDLLDQYLDTVALVKHVDTSVQLLEKVFPSGVHTIGNKMHLYFGVYGGRVKTVDREAQGVLTYDLDQLKSEIEKFPDLFTHDLKLIVDRYHKEIQAFRTLITATFALESEHQRTW